VLPHNRRAANRSDRIAIRNDKSRDATDSGGNRGALVTPLTSRYNHPSRAALPRRPY